MRSHGPRRGLIALGLTLAVAVASGAGEAVMVAPHALFIGDDAPVGEIELVNASETAEEIAVDFAYGYPVSDEAGNMRVRLMPDHAPDAPSAASWLRAFPRRVRLEPGQRQTVRIQASAPAGLAEGEYWSRLIVTATKAAEAPSADPASVNIGVGMQVRTITSITYRVGEPETGVSVPSYEARWDEDAIEVTMDMDRTGNGAYLGALTFTLEDEAGAVVHEWPVRPIAVYEPVHRVIRLDLPEEIPAGDYMARVVVSTDRPDIAATFILPAETVDRVAEVVIP